MYSHTTNMANMTLAVPEDLYDIIKQHNEIKWSEIARRAMWEQASRLRIMDRLTSKSKLTEKDVKEISEKIKEGIAKRHGL